MADKTCGGCTACCHLVPVQELRVRPFEGCPHERRLPAATVGCAIYATRPHSCALWNCQWYAEPDWPDEFRPDRCGIVVDILPDVVQIQGTEVAAIQFWVDAGHEDDWQYPDSPARDLIFSMFDAGMAVIWRTGDPSAPGRQRGRVLWRSPDGSYAYSKGDSSNDPVLGADLDRFKRALNLLPVTAALPPGREG